MIKASITHLYFESIHPFEDVNGRIGRTLAEFALSQTLETPMFLSLSKIIEKNKSTYYEQLKTAQQSLNITEWINYFSEVFLDAQIDAKELILFTLKKVKFLDKNTDQLNVRQAKAINKMLENVCRFRRWYDRKKIHLHQQNFKSNSNERFTIAKRLGYF